MRKVIFLWPATALAISCALSACGKPPGGAPPAAGTPIVGVITVQMQPVALSTELPGRTVPYQIADVRPQVNGIIKARNFREGSDVRAGQVLYQINPASYKAAYDSNLAALAKAQASVKTARLKSDRYKELVAINAVSQQDYDDAVATFGEAESDVAAAKANVELQKAGANAAKVKLILENGRTYPLEGRLEFSDVTVNQDTGAITLRAVFPNPKADLLPGMYVRAVLQEGVKEQGLLVPQQAVSRDSTGKPMAYVVSASNKIEQRALVTDRAIGDQWLVRRGLQAGDRLVVDGQQRAAPGVIVKTMPWSPNVQSTPSATKPASVMVAKSAATN